MFRAAFCRSCLSLMFACLVLGSAVMVRAPSLAQAATLDKFIAAPEPTPAPPITFTDGAGKTLSLDDFRGKVVLVNFWATWCGPCIEEMPALAKLDGALGGPDFVVVAISIDRGGAAVTKPFLDKLGAGSLGIYVDVSTKAPAAFHTPGLPTSVIIDREGRLRGKLLGPADWSGEAARTLIQGFIDSPRGAGL